MIADLFSAFNVQETVLNVLNELLHSIGRKFKTKNCSSWIGHFIPFAESTKTCDLCESFFLFKPQFHLLQNAHNMISTLPTLQAHGSQQHLQ